MDETVTRAVERAIATMRGSLSDRVTIDDLARAAMFSKFHFSRVFRRITGVSPGRFLSAMRLEEAKRLLLATNLTVADISHQVGYNSVGTFSSRFRTSVGVSPITYRHTRGATAEMPAVEAPGESPRPLVRGNITAPEGMPVGTVFVGLFPTPMLQGTPVRCAVLDRPGQYTLRDVPSGTWHVLAYAVPAGADTAMAVRPLLGSQGPISLRPGIAARLADLRLRPMRVFDPPVLTALLDVRSTALARLRSAQQLAEAG